MTITIEVFGHPQPGGSKRAFPIRAAGQLTGRVAVTDSNPTVGTWKQQVAAAAMHTVDTLDANWQPLTGPLTLDILFTLRRPASHYRTGRNAHQLRRTVPTYPHRRPDATKLLRPVEDALNGLVWRDDAQIVTQYVRKRYGPREGAEITIRELEL